MPFVKYGPNYRVPFGKNVYRGSTNEFEVVSRTIAADTVPDTVVNGYTFKMLQPGTLIARITSGPEAGKVGPFDAGATDGRQTQANIEGFNDTFLPWQLTEGNENIAVAVRVTVVQPWCLELATGAFVALTDATKTKVLAQLPNVVFHKPSLALTDQA